MEVSECVGLTSHSTHTSHFGDDFYRPHDQTNSVEALKETNWSSRSGLNPTRTTPPCYKALLVLDGKDQHAKTIISIPTFYFRQRDPHIKTIQTLNKKTENQYRENDKNTEHTKHTVKQPRQKMNVHAHLHNLKLLHQRITTRTPACCVGFPSIIHKSIKTRHTSQK